MINFNMLDGKNKIFYFNRRILKINNYDSFLSEKDIINLFMGFIKLIENNCEKRIKHKYLNEIIQLKNQLKIYETKFVQG